MYHMQCASIRRRNTTESSLTYGAEWENIKDNFTMPPVTVKSDWLRDDTRDNWLENTYLPSIKKNTKQTANFSVTIACHQGPKESVTKFMSSFQTVWESNAGIVMDTRNPLPVKKTPVIVHKLSDVDWQTKKSSQVTHQHT